MSGCYFHYYIFFLLQTPVVIFILVFFFSHKYFGLLYCYNRTEIEIYSLNIAIFLLKLIFDWSSGHLVYAICLIISYLDL